jgi:hypothetical protein
MSYRNPLPRHWTVLVLLLLGSMMLSGQDNPQNSQSGKERTATTPLQVRVTGCLDKNASGGYFVTDQFGRTWELSSRKMDLSRYVSRTVSASGHPSTGPKTEGAKSEHNQSTATSGSEYFGLDVLDLRMVSPSCSR